MCSLSPRVMEFESGVMEFEFESYGVGVRELWSFSPRVMEFESESYGG